MKSTYSVIIIATICFDHGEYQLSLEFPAAIDCDVLESYLEDIECRDKAFDGQYEGFSSLSDYLVNVAEDYAFDDEPTIKVRRIYGISLKEYNQRVTESYEDDDEMFAEANDSIQQSFCRNCGAEGSCVEPDARNCKCGQCGQNARQSLAVALNII
jgi:hypothetical protein